MPKSVEVKDKRENNFFILDDELIEEYGKDIGPLGVAIYAVLVKFANRSDNSCYPSYKTIADRLGISKSTAVKGVQLLIDKGLISYQRREDDEQGHVSNLYFILKIKKQAPATNSNSLSDPPIPDSGIAIPEFNIGLCQNPVAPIAESGHKPDPSNQTHLNQNTPTRRAGAPPSSTGNGGGVRTSKFPPEFRKEYARKNGLGPGWLTQSADGRFDEGIELQLERDALDETATAHDTRGQPIRDTSACPDCKGGGFYYPDGPSGGVAKCRHPRLNDVQGSVVREVAAST
jgi:helix-turn-helix protein